MTAIERYLEAGILPPNDTSEFAPELCDCGHHPVDCKCDPNYDERD